MKGSKKEQERHKALIKLLEEPKNIVVKDRLMTLCAESLSFS